MMLKIIPSKTQKKKHLTLYNEAVLIYGEIDLKAGIIVVDYKKETLFAKGIIDSTGYTQRPYLNKGMKKQNKILCFIILKVKEP